MREGPLHSFSHENEESGKAAYVSQCVSPGPSVSNSVSVAGLVDFGFRRSNRVTYETLFYSFRVSVTLLSSGKERLTGGPQ